VQVCAQRHDQCGGRGFTGPTCCAQRSKCVKVSGAYSTCMLKPLQAGVQPWFAQCGGEGYTGSTVCELESKCMPINTLFWQCIPDEQLATTVTPVSAGPRKNYKTAHVRFPLCMLLCRLNRPASC